MPRATYPRHLAIITALLHRGYMEQPGLAPPSKNRRVFVSRASLLAPKFFVGAHSLRRGHHFSSSIDVPRAEADELAAAGRWILANQ